MENKRMTLNEILETYPVDLKSFINKNRLQIIHEDNDTYVIEDLKQKTSMVHGRVIKVCKTPFEVIKYLNDLRAEKY
jgi:SepF-like predicted cell division protein (DUF552 family)